MNFAGSSVVMGATTYAVCDYSPGSSSLLFKSEVPYGCRREARSDLLKIPCYFLPKACSHWPVLSAMRRTLDGCNRTVAVRSHQRITESVRVWSHSPSRDFGGPI